MHQHHQGLEHRVVRVAFFYIQVYRTMSQRYRSSFGLHSSLHRLSVQSPKHPPRERNIALIMPKFSYRDFTPSRFMIEEGHIQGLHDAGVLRELGRRLAPPEGRNAKNDMKRLKRIELQIADGSTTYAERLQFSRARDRLVNHYGSASRLYSCGNWATFFEFVTSDEFIRFMNEHFIGRG